MMYDPFPKDESNIPYLSDGDLEHEIAVATEAVEALMQVVEGFDWLVDIANKNDYEYLWFSRMSTLWENQAIELNNMLDLLKQEKARRNETK